MKIFNFGGSKQRDFRRMDRLIIMASSLVVMLTVLSLLAYGVFVYYEKKQLYREYQRKLDVMKQLEVVQKQRHIEKITQDAIKQKNIKQQAVKQCSLYLMLEQLVALLPSDIRFVSVEYDRELAMTIRGEALEAKSLTNFVNSLKLKPCFKQCALEEMTKKKVKEHTCFEFILKVNLIENHGQNKKIGAR